LLQPLSEVVEDEKVARVALRGLVLVLVLGLVRLLVLGRMLPPLPLMLLVLLQLP
jgi:hypothetical protein